MKIDVPALKQTFTECLNSLSLIPELEEPWKTHFNSLKQQYNSVLSALEPVDQAPAALEASFNLQLFQGLLLQAQNLTSMLAGHRAELTKKCSELTAQVASLTTEKQALEAALPDKIQAAIDEKVKAGELVTKDLHTSLCSESKTLGLTEGEAKVRQELAAAEAQAQVLATRKAAVQTASLPLPADALLEGTDEEFAARKATAETRLAALKKLGVSHNSALLPKVWLPAEQYETVEMLAQDVFNTRRQPHEPFAGPAAGVVGFPGGCV